MTGLVKTLGVLAALALAAAAAGAGWVWRALERPYRAYPGDAATVVIEPGADARGILGQLEREGVISHQWLGLAYLRLALDEPPLKAGEYLFDEPLSLPRVLERLARGEVASHPVTVPEGLTVAETAETLAGAGFGELDALLAEMRSPDRIVDLDPEATDLEGYLFPDTYHFSRGTAAPEIVDAMVANFRDKLERQLAPLLEEGGRGGPLRDLVTLASIVEKETGRDDERGLVAAVFANRLERGIALYADPTIIYALKRLGRWDGDLRRRDLALDSPYNTYVYGGLPPGPICSPGLASLLAAARPDDADYLYFVSRNDGSHVFAETLAEHNRNVERWQRRYWRQRRGEGSH